MSGVFIKICGLRDAATAQAAVAAGANAIGLVIAAGSPRRLDDAHVIEIASALPDSAQKVLVVTDEDATRMDRLLSAAPGLIPQFHGAQSARYCRAFGVPYWRAIGAIGDIDAQCQHFADAQRFIIDAHAPGEAGGCGHIFDWTQWPSHLNDRALLAGGLNPDNIGLALQTTGARAVDVSGGVEDTLGNKSLTVINRFIKKVRDFESSRSAA